MAKIFRDFHKDEGGFTLLEMLIVLFVIGLLLLIIFPNVTKQQESAENKGDQAFEATVQTQLDLYKMDEGKAATSFAELGADYLTADQLKKANEKLTLTNGRAQLKTQTAN